MAGPGEYVTDASEGMVRVGDLPSALVERRRRHYRRRRCPDWGAKARRYGTGVRVLHDLGAVRRQRPLDLHVRYSRHKCLRCGRCFHADLADLALPHCHYTHRVEQRAVRLVIQDGLPYRAARWHLWRDHRVLVPFATIQNWVEGVGEKSGRSRPAPVPRPGPGLVQRLRGGRRGL